MKYSVIIPAHNEERLIGDCLSAIQKAQESFPHPVEIVVCLNRCSDRTEEIARNHGAIIAKEDAKNLAKIRNAGARASSGDVLVTIDADSRMSVNMLHEIDRLLSTKKYIGGGSMIKPERWSAGIIASAIVIFCFALLKGLRSAGIFWCSREHFFAVNGFNESLVTLEDKVVRPINLSAS